MRSFDLEHDVNPVSRYRFTGWDIGLAMLFTAVAVCLLGYAVGVGPKWMVRR